MTAPSRIPHGEAVRNAVRVEWMQLETAADAEHAKAWLEAHGVAASAGYILGVGTIGPYVLRLKTAGSPMAHARLGQVLAFVPESGEFSVWDWQRFVEAHPGVEA